MLSSLWQRVRSCSHNSLQAQSVGLCCTDVCVSDGSCPIRIISLHWNVLLVIVVLNWPHLRGRFEITALREEKSVCEKEGGWFTLYNFSKFFCNFHKLARRHSSPNKAASFPRHYWPVDIRCISPSALTDWRLGLKPCAPRRVSVSRHRITREGHLDQQVAGVQAPPLGLHTSLLLILSARTTDRERRRNVRRKSEGESSDRELERLIKQATIKQSEIIEAGMEMNWMSAKERQEKESCCKINSLFRERCAAFPMQNTFFRFQIIFVIHLLMPIQFLSVS